MLPATTFLDERDEALSHCKRWLSSSNPFPVDVDQLDLFKHKHKLKASLQNSFRYGVDYIVEKAKDEVSRHGGHNKHLIFLSVACLKELLMMQRTVAGKKVRRYFILAEQIINTALNNELASLRRAVSDHAAYKQIITEMEESEAAHKDEHYYQSILEQRYGSILLPRNTAHGVIDIHLPTKILELKHWKLYKHALGQLLAYGHEHSQELAVVFFGRQPERDALTPVVELFTTYHISVSYFADDDTLVDLPPSSL